MRLTAELRLEISEFLERGYYQRNDSCELKGYRNGYEKGRLNFTEGVLELEIPQVRNTVEKFRSKLLKAYRKRTECLERLIPQLYVKGMSTRDIEDTLKRQLGLEKVSKSVVSRLSKHLEEDFNRYIMDIIFSAYLNQILSTGLIWGLTCISLVAAIVTVRKSLR